MKGTIVAHVKAGPCGSISFASVTIIKLANLDTVRVLELCNDKKVFEVGEKVILAPAVWADAYENEYDRSLTLGVMLLEVNGALQLTDCLKVKTCYGTVSTTK